PACTATSSTYFIVLSTSPQEAAAPRSSSAAAFTRREAGKSCRVHGALQVARRRTHGSLDDRPEALCAAARRASPRIAPPYMAYAQRDPPEPVTSESTTPSCELSGSILGRPNTQAREC